MTDRRDESGTKLMSPRPERDDQDVMIDNAPGLVRDLGWTKEEAAETRHRLAAFADDWDDPEMDVYDDV